MQVRLRLSRHGGKKNPQYRLMATGREFPRDGKFIEILGSYDPKKGSDALRVKVDRLNYWLSKGARPSETVGQLIAGLLAGPSATPAQ